MAMTELWPEMPALAEVYDTKCIGRHDHDFYLALAEELGAQRVTDLGCGTGVFAIALVQRGHETTGIDPAAAILDIARTRPGGELVTWIEGDAASAPTDSADLIIMMGHVAQYFIDDDHWHATLHELRRAIVDGGHLSFEVRNPRRDWQSRWTKSNTIGEHDHPRGGRFTSPA